ncbi:sensor histidine kinase [Sulfurimonas sp.]
MSNLEVTVGESFASIAHQWRQPLSEINSLVGSIDNRLYELNIDDTVLIEKLLEIEKLTQSMSKVIDDFRFDTEPNEADKKITLHKIIKEAAESLSYSLRERGIELNIEADSSLVLQSSEKLLKQVLVTLLDNARDALVERNTYNPNITVSVAPEGENLFIKVCDNAGGISKSLMSKIFQADFTTKHRSEGTGLGLYMCKKLLKERLNAQIDVKNVDSGVCFTIRLNKEVV